MPLSRRRRHPPMMATITSRHRAMMATTRTLALCILGGAQRVFAQDPCAAFSGQGEAVCLGEGPLDRCEFDADDNTCMQRCEYLTDGPSCSSSMCTWLGAECGYPRTPCDARDEAGCNETPYCNGDGNGGCFTAPTCANNGGHDGSPCDGHVNQLNVTEAGRTLCESETCTAAQCCTVAPLSCATWWECTGDEGFWYGKDIPCHPLHGCSADLCCVPILTSCHQFDCTAYGRSNGLGCNGSGQPECDAITCCDGLGDGEGFASGERCSLVGEDLCGHGLVCSNVTFPPVCTPPRGTEGYDCEFDWAGCGEEHVTGLGCRQPIDGGAMQCLPLSDSSSAPSPPSAPTSVCESEEAQALLRLEEEPGVCVAMDNVSCESFFESWSTYGVVYQQLSAEGCTPEACSAAGLPGWIDDGSPKGACTIFTTVDDMESDQVYVDGQEPRDASCTRVDPDVGTVVQCAFDPNSADPALSCTADHRCFYRPAFEGKVSTWQQVRTACLDLLVQEGQPKPRWVTATELNLRSQIITSRDSASDAQQVREATFAKLRADNAKLKRTIETLQLRLQASKGRVCLGPA